MRAVLAAVVALLVTPGVANATPWQSADRVVDRLFDAQTELVLSGPADDWQRGELVRLFSQVPGVSGATWSGDDPGLPLFVEEVAGALAGFLLGLLVAYLVQLRRRYNAQWTW